MNTTPDDRYDPNSPDRFQTDDSYDPNSPDRFQSDDTSAYEYVEGEETGDHDATAAKPAKVKKARLDRNYLSRVPISHLIRHFLLFAFSILFLQTTARAGYTLWKMGEVATVSELIAVFLSGLRFDVALIGLLLAVPVFVVPLLAMFRPLRGVARFFSLTWMILAIAAVLILELFTPYTLHTQGLRPDLGVAQGLGDPVTLLSQLWSTYIIPAIVGIVLAILMFWAFIARLDIKRFLKHPVRVWPALALSLVGLALCVVAMKGTLNPPGLLFGAEGALVSKSTLINEIAGNTGYKTLAPFIPF